MMSKKQLACMLALHIMYLLVGASIFYHIESPLEVQQRAEEKLERLEIQNLLYEYYIPDDPEKQDTILRKLTNYCGKSMFNYTTVDEELPFKWDFYHSFFFSYTVVSTIGYGNLAPTTHLSRILMIFYALFGIPINGILLANLGEYFGLQIAVSDIREILSSGFDWAINYLGNNNEETVGTASHSPHLGGYTLSHDGVELMLISVYRKYKRRNEKRADRMDFFFNNLGMLGQIFLYLVPGFLFFIFLPACIFMVFEGWDYVASVYYAFVTLTTIGFGDLVAGTVNNDFKYGYFFTYQIFLIVWITFGLGYIVMLLGFITSGMRSESVHRLEQKFASQFKNTQNKILQGFTRDISAIRKIINEANLIKIKPVYVETAPQLYRSQSCPIFTFDVEPRGPIYKRKRANSENIQLSAKDMLRIQSDTDLLGIDKEKTFTASAIVRPAELLARVVNVLGGLDQPQTDKGINLFDDEHILANEKPPIFSIGQDPITGSPKRIRAQSVAVPNYRKESVANKGDHDYTWTNGESGEKFRKEANLRSGKISLPSKIIPEDSPSNLLSRIFRKPSSGESPAEYLKATMKGRVSNAQASNENVASRPRRGSIFPTFGFGSDPDKSEAEAYKEKTKRGRHSIFPTFDFNRDDTDEEDAAAIRAYQQKTKRHSIFPTFDFSEDDEDSAAKAYRDKTKSGRRSIFPTFDFSDDDAEKYKESTRRGRRSIFPTFNFSGLPENEDDTIDQEELQRYQNRTKKGRVSLFPTFGKSKKNDDDDVLPESSDELVDYKAKTRQGRKSLFPSFGKDRKGSSPNESIGGDLEASIRQYHNQINRGRNSCHESDLQNYKNSTQGGRGSSTSNDLENYRNRTRRGRPSLFDPDLNITNLPESEQVEVLENTSVADLLRALAVLETATGSGGSTSDPPGLMDLITNPMPNQRRGSIRPDFVIPSPPSRDGMEEVSGPRRRRVSVRAAAPQFTPTLATVVAGSELQITAQAARENRMSMLSQPPPPYSEMPIEEEQKPRVRRYSPAPPNQESSRFNTAPVSRLFSRRKESASNIEENDSRRGSLTDVVIDSMKDNT